MRYRWLLAVATWTLFASAGAAQEPTHASGLVYLPAEETAEITEAQMPFGGPPPSSVDLSAMFPPPDNQYELQSCVAWAVAYAVKSYQERNEEGWDYAPGGQLDRRRVFSPSFIYNQINGGRNEPTNIEKALELVTRKGAATWHAMPYTSDPAVYPNERAFLDAARYRINSYQKLRPDDLLLIKSQLVRRNPVVIGMDFDRSFDQWRGGGVWRPRGPAIGSHAMAVVGYDDSRGAYKVINSWGTGWGDQGYAWIAYDAFARMTRVAYVLFDGKNGEAPDSLTEAFNNSPTYTDGFDDYRAPTQAINRMRLVVDSLQFNLPIEDFYDASGLHRGESGFRIPGTIDVPTGVYGDIEIVASVYDRNGRPVTARYPGFANARGLFVAAHTIRLNGGGLSGASWSITIPVCALGVPSGSICRPGDVIYQTDLALRIRYFLDGQIIGESPDIPFWVGL